MINALRSEWIKLSTLTVNKVLVAVAVAFPIVITVLVAGLSDETSDFVDLNDLIAGVTLLSALLFGVVATIGMSGEFNYNTIRPTFAAQPVRLRSLTAKLTVNAVVTVVLVAALIAVCWIVGSNLADGFFPAWSIGGEPSPVRAGLLGSGLFALGVAIAGFGLGNLVRNTPAAVTLLLLWPLVIENIIGRLVFTALDLEWEKYLPFTEGMTLGFIDRGSGDEVMARFNAGVYFFAWVIGVAVLGLIRTERADA